jgi:putative flavoprotein involved in K+ transport
VDAPKRAKAVSVISRVGWHLNEEKAMTPYEAMDGTRRWSGRGPIEEGAALTDLAGLAGGDTLLAPRRREPALVPKAERFRVVVIGAGQAGLSVGYHLARRGIPFVMLDADQRVGDPWRKRWDSLRLFTPACYDSLDGMRFPAPRLSFPTKDEMADYLEAYAARFKLPIRHGVKVDRLERRGGFYVVSAGDRRFEADEVVVAMSSYQSATLPAFARELDPAIVQLQSSDYRNPSQLADGSVLVVGAGNSGADIALELAGRGQTWMSGQHPGEVPFRPDGPVGRYVLIHLVLRFVFHRVLTGSTPIGRKVRPRLLHKAGPLIRVKSRDLAAVGVERVARVTGTRKGLPQLADGRVLDVANVIWCTGYQTKFDWIDLPVFDEKGDPMHWRGEVAKAPGLYFVGLQFLHSFSSTMIHGVGRDAAYVAKRIGERVKQGVATN